FTNQQSAKADALRANPRASMTVYWHAILKQVQLAGPVEPLADDENDAYFATRPRGSQIGAWASAQSRPLESRQALLDAVAQQEQRFADVDPIPRPPHWGGYRIVADEVEIWHDGESRIHHRERFTKTDNGWEMRLLQP
ncbi:MAG: pyridoxal 5'-phosphate synthase, partial [Planctomycetota bacterium]